ncbi:DUF1822 family protein [Microcoleus sp. herbarium5]|uniref:DUF1822 family protein n=1 Tax=Microcoleus sp. herbarium5 TaxID=3055434 RepID=UPI002FD6D24E
MNSTEAPRLTVPLGSEAHRLARQLTTETLQLAPASTKREVAKRVYLNTLAVYAVYSYLKWQAYEPQLEQGDSWQPVVCARWDVADLVLPGIGKLECRPMWFGESAIGIPLEATEDRIGYVAVEFEEQLNSARLLGFVPSVEASEIQITNLQTLDDFVDYLERLELANIFLQSSDPVAVQVRDLLNTRPLEEIIAQLEQIYCNEPEDERAYAVKDVFTNEGIYAGSERELGEDVEEDDRDIELLELAEELLEKLTEIWN